jgi:TIR domain
MGLDGEALERLWARSGGSCAICERQLTADPAEVDSQEGVLLGIAIPINTGNADESGHPQTYQNAILVCPVDLGYVDGLRNWFSPSTLRRLKSSAEAEWKLRMGLDPDAVAVWAGLHTGAFDTDATPMYFLKVKNRSLIRTERIDEIWFDTQPRVSLNNPYRLLPRQLRPGQMLETWIPVSELPAGVPVFDRGRVRVNGDVVVATERNTKVSPAGFIGGLGTPLDRVAVSPPRRDGRDKESYDVFISHASEDKEEVARPLQQHLAALGVKTFIDELQIGIGQSLRERIDYGLAQSRFAVVVLSPTFIEKGWTKFELSAIVALTADGKQNVLPIWHRITKDEVQAFSPLLAGLLARSTGQYSVAEIGNEIAQRVCPQLFE